MATVEMKYKMIDWERFIWCDYKKKRKHNAYILYLIHSVFFSFVSAVTRLYLYPTSLRLHKKKTWTAFKSVINPVLSRQHDSNPRFDSPLLFVWLRAAMIHSGCVMYWCTHFTVWSHTRLFLFRYNAHYVVTERRCPTVTRCMWRVFCF